MGYVVSPTPRRQKRSLAETTTIIGIGLLFGWVAIIGIARDGQMEAVSHRPYVLLQAMADEGGTTADADRVWLGGLLDARFEAELAESGQLPAPYNDPQEVLERLNEISRRYDLEPIPLE
jgi:hypothetical protein